MLHRSIARVLALTVGATLGAVACGEPTGPREFVIRLQIAPDSVTCSAGNGPIRCLRSRELVGGDAWGEWGALYERIEGFVHQPGFTYDLIIAGKTILNPPADGSSVSFRLLKIVSTVPASQ